MSSKKWSRLNHLQLGRYAEYYAKMEFTSYGFYVYASEVDDHGIDFIAQDPDLKELFFCSSKKCAKTQLYISKKRKNNFR